MSAETIPDIVWTFRTPEGRIPVEADGKPQWSSSSAEAERVGRTYGATKLVELRRNEGGQYGIASETQILPR